MIEKIIEFHPAYDKRHSDPKKNYGIHGVDIRFLYGDKEVGYVQFLLYTNWMLPSCRKRWDEYTQAMTLLPIPADLGYHSRVPQYESQTPMNKCNLIDPCYYDGSSLNAEPIFEVLVAEGHEGVWRELEKYYNQTFNP